MLRYRLILGPLMTAALLAVLYLDDRMDRVDIEGTWLQPLLFGQTHLPPGLLLLAVFLLLIGVGAQELSRIFRAKGIATTTTALASAGAVACVLMYALPPQMNAQTALAIYLTSMVVMFIASLIWYCRHARTQGAVAIGAATMFAMLYMGALPGFYLAIRHWHSAWIVAAIILITKSCDVGAYATGRAVGRHKLIPWLSPGKTWEGLAGGVTLSAIVAVALAAAANHWELGVRWVEVGSDRIGEPIHYPLLLAAGAGLLLGLIGQFGDLVASLFKRDAGIKDSGNSIPGYGGLLDVADSPLIVAPVAYWLLMLV